VSGTRLTPAQGRLLVRLAFAGQIPGTRLDAGEARVLSVLVARGLAAVEPEGALLTLAGQRSAPVRQARPLTPDEHAAYVARQAEAAARTALEAALARNRPPQIGSGRVHDARWRTHAGHVFLSLAFETLDPETGAPLTAPCVLSFTQPDGSLLDDTQFYFRNQDLEALGVTPETRAAVIAISVETPRATVCRLFPATVSLKLAQRVAPDGRAYWFVAGIRPFAHPTRAVRHLRLVRAAGG
jgi:hypothetical protein